MKREIKVGLTLLAAIVLAYLVIAWALRVQVFAPDELSYQIRFDNVNGLLEGDPVNVRGYVSGRVLDIVPEARAVRVDITLDKEVSLTEEAHAEIQVKELMGGKQIEIFPGQGSQTLPPGGEIRGQIAWDFSSSFSEMGKVVGPDMGDRIERLMYRADTLLYRMNRLFGAIPPDQPARILTRLEQMSASAQRSLAAVENRQLISRIDSLLEQARYTFSEVDQTLAQTQTLITRLTDKTLPLAEESLEQMPVLLQNLQSLMRQLEPVLAALQRSDNLAGRMLQDAAFADTLSATLSELRAVLKQIHEEKIIVGFKRKKNKQQDD